MDCQTGGDGIGKGVGAKVVQLRFLVRKQGVLLALIELMFLIFFAQAIFGREWYRGAMAVPAEVVRSWRHLLAGEAGGKDALELLTLVSCAFLHGDFEHVLFNMLWVWMFGALLVELLGWRWMLGIFLATAVSGSVAHIALNHEKFIPMLGASGALMGFEGAYLGLAVRWPLPNPHIWPMARPVSPGTLGLLAVVGVAIDYTSLMGGREEGIAYGAHIGGFTGGLLIAALLAPRPKIPLTGFRRW